MKLKFESNQDYQNDAVQAIVNVFEGQPLEAEGISVIERQGIPQLISDMAVLNSLFIDHEQIASNTRKVQQRNELPLSEVSQSKLLTNGLNFTVEMETGTGKTYVYLRTIHELHKTYGFKKFIIVVPSLAIKEGVLKNLKITREHFANLYNNPKLDWYVWDPKKRGQARAFATNDALQIMVITIDSFTRAENIIHQQSDWGTPVEFIRATNPIVILDEPQNMETDVRKKAVELLNPLCTLRYSATHKNPYNMIYKLDPVKAYDLGLVKKIEVDSIYAEDAFNSAYLNLIKLERKGKSGLIAHVQVDVDDAKGLQSKVLKLEPGDNLAELTGRTVYDGYILDSINIVEGFIEFANAKTLRVGQRDDGLREEIMKYQIQRTVENHFEKEKKLKSQGIKVLSLFFIDRVSNYRDYTETGPMKGKFAQWFEEAYLTAQAKATFAGVLEHDVTTVHNGYFAQDKAGDWKDSQDTKGEGGKSSDDDSAYQLIMKDKERLLDPNEPLRFIFSHSALREGWDNPNVFQICTLNESTSEIRKRQEIGRGLRLPVNSDGERVRDEQVNVLTVIANESYEDFARKLQGEIESETGVDFKGRIKDKNDRRRVKLTKELELDASFKEIWERIKYKTRYSVELNTVSLVGFASDALSEVQIRRPKLTSQTAKVTMDESGIKTEVIHGNPAAIIRDQQLSIPDVLAKLAQHTKLTRPTIFEILKDADMIGAILVNPQQVIDEAVRVINQTMQQLMVDGIKYEKIAEEEWSMQLFDDKELELYIDNLALVQKQNKTVYDYVPVDSDIERDMVHELETREDVKFYFKLPPWFKIDTPLGGYNPDWAIVFEGDSRVYFVVETKGKDEIEDLSLPEKLRIKSGQAHFKALGEIRFEGPYRSFSDVLKGYNSGEEGLVGL